MTEPTAGTTESTPPADCPRPLPDPPEVVTAERALAFAETYEANRTYNRICTKDRFGLTPTTASEALHVEHRTAEGAYVFARQPFWYTEVRSEGDRSTEVHADGASSAVYFVGNGTYGRVTHRPGTVWRVDTYAPNGSDDSTGPEATRSIRLYNFGSEDRTVSVRFQYLNATTPVTVLNETLRVGAEDGFYFRDVAARPGRYRLAVTVGDGPTRTLRVSIPESGRWLPDVAAYVAPDGDLSLTLVPRDDR